MNDSKLLDRTLALAGIFQAAKMVKNIAWYGKCPEEKLEIAIKGLLKQHAATTQDIYSGAANLKDGIHDVINLFEKKNNIDNEVTRYALSIIHLEKSLQKKPEMQTVIRDGIARAKRQADIFHLTHDNVIANIASIYTDSISTFKFRIHVTGEPSILNNTLNANKVRTLLLFGIRSAVLWRQLGGSRWQLILSKKGYVKSAKNWLQKVELIEKETSHV